MATGTFAYNALRTKTLKEGIKTQRNIVSPSNSTRQDLFYSAQFYRTFRLKLQRQLNTLQLRNKRKNKSNVVSVGTTAIKPYLSICLVGLVWFARYCGKMAKPNIKDVHSKRGFARQP